jgi:uncharacterized SAM-binding protein YcdF (DUF218 family)
VFLVALAAPFEVTLLTIGPLTFTSLEVASLAAIGASLTAILYARQAVVWRTPLTHAAAACLVVLVIAALFSPVDRANALRFTARMTTAAALFLLVINAVTTRDLARAVVRSMLGIAVVVAIVGVLEAAQVRSVLNTLTFFRPGFHVVGGQLRATSTMFYPTIASMYLEVVFALGLWLVLESGQSWRTTFAALVVIAAGIIATFTRAGIIAMGSAIVVVAALRWLKLRQFDGTQLRLAALAATIFGMVMLSRSPDVLLARWRSEGSQDWYGATYSVPATLQFRTGTDYQVPVTLENTGRVVWDSSSEPMFAMSYHWLQAGSEMVVQFGGWRTTFPVSVEPNTRITLPVNVRAPSEPGTYVLVWDVVHEHRAWLSTEGVTPGRTIVQVAGTPLGATPSEMKSLPPTRARIDRVMLWRTALGIAASHPLFGIGPDNFRQASGSDSRVHANSMYFETLAGAGIAGLTALVWLLVTSGLALLNRWRRASLLNAIPAGAFCAVWIVIAGHGLVDTFLSFTTTYVTFALAAGLAFADIEHADRV